MNPLHPPECAGCPYDEIGGTFIPPENVPGAKLVVWGEAGGEIEAQRKRPFVGPSGKTLRRCEQRVKLRVNSGWPDDITPSEDVEHRNVVLCRPPGGNKFPGFAIANECMKRHQSEFLRTDDRSWLACGANAIEALTGHRLAPLSIRGTMLPARHASRWLKATIHPAFLHHRDDEGKKGKSMPELEPLLCQDIRLAVECPKPRVPKVHVDPVGDKLLTHLSTLDKIGLLSVDIEGKDGQPNIVGIAVSDSEAFVLPWSENAREILNVLFSKEGVMPVFHNAIYDVPELELAGVTPPKQWVDTIVLAGLFDPGILKRLGVQVLSWVPGTIMWKGLINHELGPDSLVDKKGNPVPALHREIWSDVLENLGRRVPSDGTEWYYFYNGLDAAWTYALAKKLRSMLEAQGRFQYYEQVLQPLQAPLQDMGERGIPVDMNRMAYHREACQRLQRMATKILREIGDPMLKENLDRFQNEVDLLVFEREKEASRKFSKAEELKDARTALRQAKAIYEKGFSFDSFKQCKQLLYERLGLPEVRKKGKVTTDDDAVESLLKRLTRVDENGDPAPSFVPKGGQKKIPIAVRVLRARSAGKKWAHWERMYMHPPVKDGRIPTIYSMHRADTGRFTSGMDTSDPDKSMGKRKVAQLQNVPRKIRDAFVAEPGHVFIGGDWAGLEWAIAMWFCSRLPGSNGYHAEMLDKFFAGEFDPHRFLAAHAFGVEEGAVSKRQRQTCKSYTHGYFFGGSANGLADEAGQPRSVGARVCSAHDRAFKGQEFRATTVQMAKGARFVQTPLGWRRWFWEYSPKPTEILGTRVQATAGCLCKWVLHTIYRDCPPEYEILTTTHDSFLMQARIELAQEAGQWLKKKMEQPVPWMQGRRWRADVRVGPSWRSVS